LNEAERAEVFEVLCSERFADRAPAEVYATRAVASEQQIADGGGHDGKEDSLN